MLLQTFWWWVQILTIVSHTKEGPHFSTLRTFETPLGAKGYRGVLDKSREKDNYGSIWKEFFIHFRYSLPPCTTIMFIMCIVFQLLYSLFCMPLMHNTARRMFLYQTTIVFHTTHVHQGTEIDLLITPILLNVASFVTTVQSFTKIYQTYCP